MLPRRHKRYKPDEILDIATKILSIIVLLLKIWLLLPR
jgi:hypothetical protein